MGLCRSLLLGWCLGHLLDVGGCAVVLPKGAHDPRVKWSATIVKQGIEAQPS
ncbi:MAG: hypothetical protein J7J20_02100 [Desulfurococcales archaeon]|nr:hypothetical protein [Desulfurococcales archaeon]